MIDDMHGLYEFASQAHADGRRLAIEDIRRVVGLRLSRISVRQEKNGSVEAFHVAEACGAALREGLAAIESHYKIKA